MRIQLKLSLWLAAVLLIMGTLAAATILSFQRKVHIQQFEGMAHTLSVTIGNALRHSMLHNRPEEMKEILGYIKRNRTIRQVSILTRQKKVWVATEEAEMEENTVATIEKVIAQGQASVRWLKGEGFHVVTPVVNDVACQSCHPANVKVLAALDVVLQDDILVGNLRRSSQIIGMFAGLTFLLALGTMLYLMRKAVIQRLCRVAEAARGARAGGTPVRIEDTRPDELGDLATAFNQMSEKIWGYTQDLSARASELAQRLANLNVLGETLSSAPGFDQVLERITETTRELLHSGSCVIYLTEKEGNNLLRRWAAGHNRLPERMPLREGILGWVAREKKPAQAPAGAVEQLLAVPLVVRNNLMGVMAAQRKGRQSYTAGDLSLLSTIGHQVAIAIDNRQLFEEVRLRKEQLTRLFERCIAVQEEERKRIARELHDEAGQALNALIINLESMEQSLGGLTGEATKKLAELRNLTSHTLDEIHKVIYDLRPSLLDDLGLVPAIRWYAKSYIEKVGIEVRYDFTNANRRLNPPVETALFRIVQEALSNIIKHARARHVAISLDLQGDWALATVEDDGQGFDAPRLLTSGERKEALGLLGMQERAAILGGTLTIQSRPGQGSRIEARVPL